MFGINGEIVNARVHNLKMGPSKILHTRVQNLPISEILVSSVYFLVDGNKKASTYIVKVSVLCYSFYC